MQISKPFSKSRCSTKAIELDPKSDDGIYYNRGLIYANKQELETAIQDFDKAIDLDPESDAGVYYNRGLAHAGLGNLKAALQDYSTSIRLAPAVDAGIYFNRGLVYAQSKELDAAILDFTKAIEIDPTSVAALRERAWAHRELGSLADALSDLRRYRDLQPDTENQAQVEQWIAELEDEQAQRD